MEVSGQPHAPGALSPGKEPPVPVREEVGWARVPICTKERREKFPAPAGSRTPGFQPVASATAFTFSPFLLPSLYAYTQAYVRT